MTRKVLAILGLVVACFALTAVTGWGALVLYYLAPGSDSLRTILAWGFAAVGLAGVGALAVRRARRPAAVIFTAALVLVAWSSATPSNDRDWRPEVGVLPYATFDGDLVTVHNIRNFDYRTEEDFTPAY